MSIIKGITQLSETALYRPSAFYGRDRYNTGFEDIFGASYEQLGFKNLIKRERNNKVLNEVLWSLVLMRVFSPASKLRSCCLLEEYFNKGLSHKQVLLMMNHLSRREEIEEEIPCLFLKARRSWRCCFLM